MKALKAISGVALTCLIVFLGNTRFGQIPPVLKFLDPHQGFWQNAELLSNQKEATVSIPGLSAESKVVFDERGVPHIFAQNNHDLYCLQGYLTAKDRLWQMEFQTHAAAGRLSEIVGEKALDFDLEQRRIGMGWAAEKAMTLIPEDSTSKEVLQAYAEGVNHYIASLQPHQLPVEYKLLNYKPEPWSEIKSSLLLKYMAKMLNGTERDRPNTEAYKLLGPEMFNRLFPDQNYLDAPIVAGFAPDTSLVKTEDEVAVATKGSWNKGEIQPHIVGSNNWAVSGSRTENGVAVLCNDPHLRLSLPSIWYEVQLHGPNVNCYGVSLPGAPGITIGFNDSISWGVTNAGRDVKDYYNMAIVDASAGTYRFGDEVLTAEKRVEEIKIRGQESVFDTVLYTVLGPIAYADSKENQQLALRWFAHDPSNELQTFYKLNRAKNFTDYQKALSTYNCPGQNFVFADSKNNIAIWQQGKFKIKPKNYGRFILDGTDASHAEERFIPQEHNPHVLNPQRGFVSSANQPAADTTYPYYFSGVYEEFRNRTINRFLAADSSVTKEDMMALQLSNHNLLAEEALPLMLALLDTSKFHNDEYDQLALSELQSWNYSNDKGIIAPTVFEIWWDELNNMLWDEFNSMEWDQDMYYKYSWAELAENGKAKVDMKDERYIYPMAKITIDFLKNEPNHIVFDHHSSNNKIESAQDVVNDAFYWTVMKFSDIIKYKLNYPHWGHYQGTRVKHLMRLDAFSSPKLFVGGSENAPNATTSTHGPSWRMIVEMHPDGPKAWGVLPGGQSGNPGSPTYVNSLEKWASGEYNELNFLSSSDVENSAWSVQTFSSSTE
ncbi:MAG: penicillin acylase family protein [Flavobacteriales bacterium]